MAYSGHALRTRYDTQANPAVRPPPSAGVLLRPQMCALHCDRRRLLARIYTAGRSGATFRMPGLRPSRCRCSAERGHCQPQVRSRATARAVEDVPKPGCLSFRFMTGRWAEPVRRPYLNNASIGETEPKRPAPKPQTQSESESAISNPENAASGTSGNLTSLESANKQMIRQKST